MIKYLIIFFAGIFAGFINVHAGGGSILTIPALILLGLSPTVANGTNRISILSGALAAVYKFKKNKVSNNNAGLFLGIPAVLGAIVGSLFAVNISDKLFSYILSAVMIFVLIAIFLRPSLKTGCEEEGSSIYRSKPLAWVLFFMVGLYGGFIQAGVGILIMGMMAITTRLSLLRVNAAKMFVVALYTVFALLIFILNDKVNYLAGIILAIGSALGSYLGAMFAIKKGEKFIKIVFAVSIILMTLKILKVF